MATMRIDSRRKSLSWPSASSANLRRRIALLFTETLADSARPFYHFRCIGTRPRLAWRREVTAVGDAKATLVMLETKPRRDEKLGLL